MTNPHKAVCLSAVILVACASLSLAQGTYTQIDVPGSTFTSAQGINNAGDIVGLYFDHNGDDHGFLLSGGTYTTIDYPGILVTSLSGINDAGQIVGYGYRGGDVFVGFRYDIQTSSFTEIKFPGTRFTLPIAINDSATVAGQVPSHSDAGFELLQSGRGRLIRPHSAQETEMTGVTASGVVVGFCVPKGGGILNFSFNRGRYRQLVIPNAPHAYVLATNPAGTALAGKYQTSPPITYGYVYQNKTLQTLQFPGSNFTRASGINDGGKVVGAFSEDGGYPYHGFIWTPPADASKK